MPRRKSDSDPSKPKTRSTSKSPRDKKVSRPRLKKPAASKSSRSVKGLSDRVQPRITHEQFRGHIARRAYELFEQGGAQHGQHVDHWVQAERELEEELKLNKV